MSDGKHKRITCRYGVKYTVPCEGTSGEKRRLAEMLSKCCCFVCYNRLCKEPRDERLEGCQKVCLRFTKKPYCEKD